MSKINPIVRRKTEGNTKEIKQLESCKLPDLSKTQGKKLLKDEAYTYVYELYGKETEDPSIEDGSQVELDEKVPKDINLMPTLVEKLKAQDFKPLQRYWPKEFTEISIILESAIYRTMRPFAIKGQRYKMTQNLWEKTHEAVWHLAITHETEQLISITFWETELEKFYTHLLTVRENHYLTPKGIKSPGEWLDDNRLWSQQMSAVCADYKVVGATREMVFFAADLVFSTIYFRESKKYRSHNRMVLTLERFRQDIFFPGLYDAMKEIFGNNHEHYNLPGLSPEASITCFQDILHGHVKLRLNGYRNYWRSSENNPSAMNPQSLCEQTEEEESKRLYDLAKYNNQNQETLKDSDLSKYKDDLCKIFPDSGPTFLRYIEIRDSGNLPEYLGRKQQMTIIYNQLEKELGIPRSTIRVRIREVYQFLSRNRYGK